MVDVEFVVQFLVLAHAAGYPQAHRRSGNTVLLGMVEVLDCCPQAWHALLPTHTTNCAAVRALTQAVLAP
jgi:glutamine synthetase adenylyltransferase